MVRSFNDFVFISRLKKVKQTSSASKKELTHPKYLDMVVAIIKGAKDDSRMGLSKSAILKMMREAYDVGINERFINTQLNLALKRGLAKDVLKMAKKKGKGSGHYKLVEKSSHESKVAKMTEKKVTKVQESAAGFKLNLKATKTRKVATKNMEEIVKVHPQTIKERMRIVEFMNEFNENNEDDIFASASAKTRPKLLSQDSESEAEVSIQVARTPIQAYKGKTALLPFALTEVVPLSPRIPKSISSYSHAAFLQNKVTEKRKGDKELGNKSKLKNFGGVTRSMSRKKQDLVMNERSRDIANIINFTATNKEESE